MPGTSGHQRHSHPTEVEHNDGLVDHILAQCPCTVPLKSTKESRSVPLEHRNKRNLVKTTLKSTKPAKSTKSTKSSQDLKSQIYFPFCSTFYSVLDYVLSPILQSSVTAVKSVCINHIQIFPSTQKRRFFSLSRRFVGTILHI